MTHATDILDHPIRSHNATPSATWSRPGGAYDEISRGILDAIEHCTNRLAPPRDGRVLDVATGTGWAARRLAERGVRVTGVDFAPDLLAAAKEMAGARDIDITFELGDAEALPYPDASFDAVMSSFGIMFVQRPEDAAAEIARVCKPGGRISLATWTPDGNVFEMFKIMKSYMPKPDGTPPPSPFEWGSRERLTSLLGDHFDLAFEQGTSFYREPDGEAAWRTFVEGYGPLRTLVGKLDEADARALERDFVAFHASFATDLGVCVPRDYLVAAGTRR
ncbi:class I SAM-dependent methyltransferase [Aquicoccus porphyridii]|uniref:Class I SAM-dependent methyltransferase n=1 Tax=Aquicoccus porphyridii TaxID=1852029 RepID=A0A5A9YXX4_9RHOB|nr:class I SAM-dependent methyltransferase [Aquicoccus porphyridii]KAA0909736.1 class I SAM-dependent methyltransferase [Aquicoccus porphyridii]RAI52004.1 methyltransferase type 11 [Rhodobacteraceae bacterium AsT-22]